MPSTGGKGKGTCHSADVAQVIDLRFQVHNPAPEFVRQNQQIICGGDLSSSTNTTIVPLPPTINNRLPCCPCPAWPVSAHSTPFGAPRPASAAATSNPPSPSASTASAKGTAHVVHSTNNQYALPSPPPLSYILFLLLTMFSIYVFWPLTRSFFFRSGVRKPFFAFFARPASSNRLRTSAFLRSRSARNKRCKHKKCHHFQDWGITYHTTHNSHSHPPLPIVVLRPFHSLPCPSCFGPNVMLQIPNSITVL